ncbi:hypothetical protein ACTL6U_09195 [Rhodovibrionaceae bacterium A322]
MAFAPARHHVLPLLGMVLLLGLPASTAQAHAFGMRYDLPLPLWLYLVGAGAAVALSFVILAVTLRRGTDRIEDFHLDLLKLPGLKILGSPVILATIRGLSVALFLLLLATCFWGTPDPFENLAPIFIWVIWWVGMAFVSVLLGNLWDLVNPWKILFTWLEEAWPNRPAPVAYPDKLGHWPALLLFLLFIWMELIAEQTEQPPTLGLLILLYSALTWAGMLRYGKDSWLARGAVFSVVFSLLARFAMTHGEGNRWLLRPPAVGLLCRDPVSFSGICFVLLLLTSVTFDGLLETPLWASTLDWIAESQGLRPLLLSLQEAGADLIAVIKTLALLLAPLFFLLIYFLASKAIALAGGGSVRLMVVAGSFILSLVPIAIAYHLAHYLSYLLIAGQNIIPLLSDPFGWGWDLFGTRSYGVDISVVSAKMVWYLAVSAIVMGHVLAVYIGHVMALRVFPDRGLALRSQLPMLVLMVAYTMVSLWILSQPIVAE